MSQVNRREVLEKIADSDEASEKVVNLEEGRSIKLEKTQEKYGEYFGMKQKGDTENHPHAAKVMDQIALLSSAEKVSAEEVVELMQELSHVMMQYRGTKERDQPTNRILETSDEEKFREVRDYFKLNCGRIYGRQAEGRTEPTSANIQRIFSSLATDAIPIAITISASLAHEHPKEMLEVIDKGLLSSEIAMNQERIQGKTQRSVRILYAMYELELMRDRWERAHHLKPESTQRQIDTLDGELRLQGVQKRYKEAQQFLETRLNGGSPKLVSLEATQFTRYDINFWETAAVGLEKFVHDLKVEEKMQNTKKISQDRTADYQKKIAVYAASLHDIPSVAGRSDKKTSSTHDAKRPREGDIEKKAA